MTSNQKGGEVSVQPNAPPSHAQTASRGHEMSFIHQEPPMMYQPPGDAIERVHTEPVVLVHEPVTRWVTPLEQLKSTPEEVDCPYCRRAVKTEIRQVETDDDGMMKCLICLVCWPLLLCYEGNKDLNHHCSECGKQLTHQPSGSGRVQVVAQENQAPAKQPSRF